VYNHGLLPLLRKKREIMEGREELARHLTGMVPDLNKWIAAGDTTFRRRPSLESTIV
jgi:hypothetical protein